ncbi:MAG: glycosyltransferase [Kiritimatiellae bacterium]|nr:glycosyltransferase [Kiritimatiellia bacterium]
MKRFLIVVSDQTGRFDEHTPAKAHFEQSPFSLAAIRYHLELLGWTTCYAPVATAAHPLRLARLIDRFAPDIVYTYGGTVSLHPLFCRRFLCRHRRFKVVHGWDDVYGEVWRSVYGRVPGILMDWMERRIIRNSDAVVTLSYYNQMRGRQWGVESHYIPNGADEPQVDCSACDIRLQGRFKLVYTGAMDRWKRTWEVCEAMRRLPSDIRLYLTGPGSERMREYASENCIFLGFLPRQQQLCVMSQADALVVTADQDCNAKLQEYLRFKKPILGYDGRLNLFFKNGRNALLTRDYAAAIQRLAADAELRAALVRHAAADIPVYSWLEIARQFEDFFEQLMRA